MIPLRRAWVVVGTLLHHERRRQCWPLSAESLDRLAFARWFRSACQETLLEGFESLQVARIACSRFLNGNIALNGGLNVRGNNRHIDGSWIARHGDAELAETGG